MNHQASILSALTLTLLVSVSASAQQTTGVPGSPNATTTIDGRYLPPPPQKFRARSILTPRNRSRLGRRASCRQRARPTSC